MEGLAGGCGACGEGGGGGPSGGTGGGTGGGIGVPDLELEEETVTEVVEDGISFAEVCSETRPGCFHGVK